MSGLITRTMMIKILRRLRTFTKTERKRVRGLTSINFKTINRRRGTVTRRRYLVRVVNRRRANSFILLTGLRRLFLRATADRNVRHPGKFVRRRRFKPGHRNANGHRPLLRATKGLP